MNWGWLYVLGGFGLVALAWHVHRHVRGFLPEDPPAPRKPKPWPMPMIGWLIAAVGLLLMFAAGMDAYWLGGAVLAWVAGTLDDFRKHKDGVVWWQKAILLLVAVGLAGHGLGHAGWPALAFLFVIVNAVNFLDNTDGVALGVAAVPLALVASPTGSPQLGSLGAFFLGMVPFNWPRSRVILGDGGAYVLGLALGSAALAQASLVQTFAVTAVPLVDFVQVVLARLWLGYAPWIADRRHLTHIVIHGGVDRVLVAPLFTLCAVAILGILRCPPVG